MIKDLIQFFPRTWRVRREKEITETAATEARLANLGPSIRFLAEMGLPQNAAWDIALQLSGVPNTESVLSRLSRSDWERMQPALGKSETLAPAILATRTASNEALRDLLTRIIKGELEESDGTPRSVMELVNKLGKKDLETFLRLRRVLWKEHDVSWGSPRSTIYCMQDARSYPGLLDHDEINRLVELGLISFGPVPYQSSFPGPKAAKRLGFGNRRIAVVSTKPDATLYLGHLNLLGDGRHIIELYDESCEMLYDHFEAACAEWRKQDFIVDVYGPEIELIS